MVSDALGFMGPELPGLWGGVWSFRAYGIEFLEFRV